MAKISSTPDGFLFEVRRGFVTNEEQFGLLYLMPTLNFRTCPRWLGNFDFITYRTAGKRPPLLVENLADRLKKILPNNQGYNTIFVQRYVKGQEVKPHRDPRNNIGYTAMAVLGAFEGAETVVAPDHRLKLEKKDAFILRCNYRSLPRPLHRVNPVTKGLRYTIIINEINYP